MSIYLLDTAVQNYAWGKTGNKSSVACLKQSQMMNFEKNWIINPEENYAELWIGTHPNGPSTLAENNKALADFVKENASFLGDGVRKTYGDVSLPFLLKVKRFPFRSFPFYEAASYRVF